MEKDSIKILESMFHLTTLSLLRSIISKSECRCDETLMIILTLDKLGNRFGIFTKTMEIGSVVQEECKERQSFMMFPIDQVSLIV